MEVYSSNWNSSEIKKKCVFQHKILTSTKYIYLLCICKKNYLLFLSLNVHNFLNIFLTTYLHWSIINIIWTFDGVNLHVKFLLMESETFEVWEENLGKVQGKKPNLSSKALARRGWPSIVTWNIVSLQEMLS